MPVELEGQMTKEDWEQFRRDINNDLEQVNQLVAKFHWVQMLLKLVQFCAFAALVAKFLWFKSNIRLEIPFVLLLFFLVTMQMFLNRWIVKQINQAFKRVEATCLHASEKYSTLSFLMKEEFSRKRRVRYIEASKSDVIGPEHIVITAQDGVQPVIATVVPAVVVGQV